MSFLTAIILGIIQGLTEFLPVSSSGHLEIAKVILGENAIHGENILMTVVLHFATALSTVVVFRKELLRIIRGLFQFKWNDELKFSIKIIFSMIPAAVVGVLFEKEIDGFFGGKLLLVGSMLVITGLLLFLADRAKGSHKDVTFMNSILIGISQAIAILPGISRSGATISTSVLLHIDREKAARFSFLMVVPLIFGKMAKDVFDGGLFIESVHPISLIIGFIVAFITGLIACTWMISLVKNAKLRYFSYYCFIVGIGAVTYTLF